MIGELETEQRLQHIDPSSSGYSRISFPFSWAAQAGAWGPSFFWDIVLIPASSFQMIWTSCRIGLYNNLTSTYFLWASHFTLSWTRRQSSLSPDIFDQMYLLFTQVHFLFWQLAQGPICNKITSKETRVSCVRIRKKSGNLSYAPRISLSYLSPFWK